jgi:hypothetical protein
MRCNSTVRSLYFKIFSASFLITLLLLLLSSSSSSSSSPSPLSWLRPLDQFYYFQNHSKAFTQFITPVTYGTTTEASCACTLI